MHHDKAEQRLIYNTQDVVYAVGVVANHNHPTKKKEPKKKPYGNYLI